MFRNSTGRLFRNSEGKFVTSAFRRMFFGARGKFGESSLAAYRWPENRLAFSSYPSSESSNPRGGSNFSSFFPVSSYP